MDGTIKFVVQECCNCGMAFYMTRAFDERRRNDHKLFYCPAGHNQYYVGKSEAEKLREQLEDQQKRTVHFQQEATQNRQDRERVERRLSAMKGQVTKANNKLKKGVCPCCEEHFPDLENHIKAQHPDFEIDQSGTTDPTFDAPTAAPAAKRKRGRPRKVKENA